MEIGGESPVRAVPPPLTSHLPWKQQQKQRADAPPSDDNSSYDIQGFNRALECGMALTNHYGSDKRVKVQSSMKMSSGLVAYDDPLNAGDPVSKFAGQEARDELAEEVNSAIMEWQGRQRDFALDRLYRQAGGVVRQLGVMGEGLAAFVDMEREFCRR